MPAIAWRLGPRHFSPLTRRRSPTSAPTGAASGRCGSSWSLFVRQPVRRVHRQRPAAPGALRRRASTSRSFVDYPETDVRRRLRDRGRLPRSRIVAEADRGRRAGCVWPPIPLQLSTRSVHDLPAPAPSPPSRAELARHRRPGARRAGAADLRLPHLGAVRLRADDLVSSIIGIAAGAVQGYFGGWVDLLVPALHRDLVGHAAALPADHPRPASSQPSFWLLLVILLLFQLDGAGRRGARRVPARAQLRLRARAPRARASATRAIMFRHVLPNAMVATLTFLPFILSRLDHGADRARLPRLRPAAGLAVARRAADPGQEQPAGAVARHHRLRRASRCMLTLLIFIGEAVRDAFDPRKTLPGA